MLFRYKGMLVIDSSRFGVRVTKLSERVTVSIFNGGAETEVPQHALREDRVHGLTLLKEDLRKFDADLDWGPAAEVIHPSATFQVTLSLMLWNGVSK